MLEKKIAQFAKNRISIIMSVPSVNIILDLLIHT